MTEPCHGLLSITRHTQNTGTLLRLAACLGIAVASSAGGLRLSDRNFRRAGLDYLDDVEIARHASWEAFDEWRGRQRGPPDPCPRNRQLITETKAAPTRISHLG